MKKILLIGIAVAFVLGTGSYFVLAEMTKTVTVQFSDGKETIESTGLHNTLTEVLESEDQDVAKIKQKYIPSVPWDSPLQDEMKVDLICKCNVSLTVGDKKIGNFQTTKTTVKEILAEKKIKLGPWDEMNVHPDDRVTDGLDIVIDKVEERVTKEVKKIDYKTEEKKDDELPKGEEKVEQKGKEGREVFLVTQLYKNGKPMMENGKPVISKKLVEKVDPVKEIVRIGTNETVAVDDGMPSGTPVKFESTCYNLQGTTASGVPAGKGKVAVDPNVIPLGTKLWIEGYGDAVAADTGGAIKGKIIDVWLPTDADCEKWGRRTVNVIIKK